MNQYKLKPLLPADFKGFLVACETEEDMTMDQYLLWWIGSSLKTNAIFKQGDLNTEILTAQFEFTAPQWIVQLRSRSVDEGAMDPCLAIGLLEGDK